MRKDKQNGCGKLACSFYELYTMFCVQSRSIWKIVVIDVVVVAVWMSSFVHHVFALIQIGRLFT